MEWIWVVLGFAVSALILLLLAAKWKFPKKITWVGASAVSLVVALPFPWLYSQVDSRWVLAAVFCCQVGAALALGLSLVLMRFWRDPDRTPPDGDGLVISPADGKIDYVVDLASDSVPIVTKAGRNYLVAELIGTEPLAKATHLIGVEMSFLDVHVNRSPIDGKVTFQKHIEGGFMSLGREEAQFLNARCTTVIENPSLTLAVVQAASRLVRRVDSYLRVNEEVTRGQRMGIIRFGSLVVVVLPQRDDLQILVKPGDRVTAGVSVLARHKDLSGE